MYSFINNFYCYRAKQKQFVAKRMDDAFELMNDLLSSKPLTISSLASVTSSPEQIQNKKSDGNMGQLRKQTRKSEARDGSSGIGMHVCMH